MQQQQQGQQGGDAGAAGVQSEYVEELETVYETETEGGAAAPAAVGSTLAEASAGAAAAGVLRQGAKQHQQQQVRGWVWRCGCTSAYVSPAYSIPLPVHVAVQPPALDAVAFAHTFAPHNLHPLAHRHWATPPPGWPPCPAARWPGPPPPPWPPPEAPRWAAGRWRRRCCWRCGWAGTRRTRSAQTWRHCRYSMRGCAALGALLMPYRPTAIDLPTWSPSILISRRTGRPRAAVGCPPFCQCPATSAPGPSLFPCQVPHRPTRPRAGRWTPVTTFPHPLKRCTECPNPPQLYIVLAGPPGGGPGTGRRAEGQAEGVYGGGAQEAGGRGGQEVGRGPRGVGEPGRAQYNCPSGSRNGVLIASRSAFGMC